MRVISGSAGGRRLRCLDGRRIRPTQDRVKEAVFSSIMPRLPGSRVLDLFAGSGALGIEALSRGAGAAVFVETDVRACALIRANLTLCGWTPSARIRIVRADALRWLDAEAAREEAEERFGIIFADPPYQKGYGEKVLRVLSEGEMLSPEGVLVLESAARQVLPESLGGLYLDKDKRYGDTKISYYHTRSCGQPAGAPDSRKGEVGGHGYT